MKQILKSPSRLPDESKGEFFRIIEMDNKKSRKGIDKVGLNKLLNT
jgi:hypothetical protein